MPNKAVFVPKLESEAEIRKIATALLQRSGVYGNLPTPIEPLVHESKLKIKHDLTNVKEAFLSRSNRVVREKFASAWQKVRGIADMRDKVIYVKDDLILPPNRFTAAHELGHQNMGWHNLDPGFVDNHLTLSSETKEMFEKEANYFAAEVLFQGRKFRNTSRDFRPEFNSVFYLANIHLSSKHATLRRFVDESDEVIAGIPYWPDRNFYDSHVNPILVQGKMFASPRFLKKYGDLQIPSTLNTDHEWVAAREFSRVANGKSSLKNYESRVQFDWESWWNSYCLMILLRKPPRLRAISKVGSLIHGKSDNQPI